jgi:hypothetical protein
MPGGRQWLEAGLRTPLVRSRQRNVKRQDLVGVPGGSLFLEAGDLGELDVGLVDGGADRDVSGTDQGALEDGCLADELLLPVVEQEMALVVFGSPPGCERIGLTGE